MGRATMGGGDAHLVPYVNTWFWPSATLVGTSSLMFSIYIGKVTNAHEWKEVFLDYCHHKRTFHSPNPMDTIARSVLRLLRIAPSESKPVAKGVHVKTWRSFRHDAS